MKDMAIDTTIAISVLSPTAKFVKGLPIKR